MATCTRRFTRGRPL